ncbi:MAG: GYF domain-containing protein [Planctomycetales bacterium]|jgi:hypothetical protein
MAMILESADGSQRFPLDRESIFVGSSERKSDICLTGPGIAEVHCELTLQDDGVRVVALAESGVIVNGETVREATLSDGDEFGIATLRFRLADEAADVGSELPGSQCADPPAEQEPIAPHLSRWVVRMSGMNLGPLDWDELQSMIGRGEIRLDDEVQREHEETWQPLRDVLPQNGGDALLCDDDPVEPVDFIPRQRRDRPKRKRRAAASEVTDQERPASRDKSPAGHPEIAENEVPLAPQFFIMQGEDEVGPLPRQAIQELADQGSLFANTPVRLEDAEKWSTAVAVGIHCSAAVPTDASVDLAAAQDIRIPATGIAWLVFAPYYFVTGAARSVAGLDPRRAAKWAVPILIVGVVAFGWLRSWSQTAMRGVVSLDGQPVADVLVQLAGARTGDSAMGVSDGGGNFRVVTLDGDLKPGLYLVTVRPLSEVNGNHAATDGSESSTTESKLPDRYRHLNTTDATIEITADQSRYSVELTTQPQNASGGFRDGALSASHTLP